MWTLTLLLAQVTQPVTLGFKQREEAEVALAAILNAGEQENIVPIEVEDDFGTILTLPAPDQVAAIRFEKYESALEVHFEMQLLQMQAQAKFQQRVQSDAKLRFLQGGQMPGSGIFRP